MNIGILTSGGDCPGLNSIIRAVVLSTVPHGHKVYGFFDGFEGLIKSDYMEMTLESVYAIENRGGTILGTTNKGHFGSIGQGKEPDEDALSSLQAITDCGHKLHLDALIAVGGDGSLRIAQWVCDRAGINIIGIPKTIDNDIMHTEISVGYNSAVSTATDAVNKIQDTGASHKRVMVIEVMGRTAGWLTLETAIAAGADVVLIPEIPFSYEKVKSFVQSNRSTRTHACTVLVAEGAYAQGEEMTMHKASQELMKHLQTIDDMEVRLTVLGHIQRGGSPTVYDIVLGSKLGARAVEMAISGKSGRAIMVQNGLLVDVSIDDLAAPTRLVPADHDLVKTARSLGMYFGD